MAGCVQDNQFRLGKLPVDILADTKKHHSASVLKLVQILDRALQFRWPSSVAEVLSFEGELPI